MAKTRRTYTGNSVSTLTDSAILSSGNGSFDIKSSTGWPYGSDPFFVVVEPGTASEEKILVTRSGATDTTLNVSSRAQDGTSAVAHAKDVTVYPVFTALDADEANELASSWASKGDLVSYGSSTFETLGVGSDAEVLIADSGEASGLKWGQVTASGIANLAVTTGKLADSAVSSQKLANGSVIFSKLSDQYFKLGTYYASGGTTTYTVNFSGGSMAGTPVIVATAAGNNSVEHLLSAGSTGFTVKLANTTTCYVNYMAFIS
jgi:hypothetical protein